MRLSLQLAQDVLPTTDGLAGDSNLIWVIGLLLALLSVTNVFWAWRDRVLMKELRGDKKKMLRIAIRTTRAVEAVAGFDEPTNEELGIDDDADGED